MGRRDEAVPATEEAVTLYREQAAANPAYLPDLARTLGNLGNRYGEVGRRDEAVPATEEAVTLYREQAAANPAYLPDLARTLGNLGNRYGEVGRRDEAVPATEEAVTLYREQAAANPAYLPDLARTLGYLGLYRLAAGLPWNAGAAWSSALDAMPTSDFRAGLLLEKARREDPPQAVSDILAALALMPPATGSVLYSLHSACRELRNHDHDLFDPLWQDRLKTGQPPWLFIDDVTLTTTDEWLATPSHMQAREYHRDHAEILARPQARTALDELALLGTDPDLISQYQQLLITASEQGIQDAYEPLVVPESLSAWLNADIPEQQQLLRENREMLLSKEASDLLGQWSAELPGNTTIKFGAALLSLAQEGLESEVFAALDDHEQLDAFLGDLAASARPQQLLAAAELVLCLDLDDQALATAQLHLAIALVLTGHAEGAPEQARAAAGLDPNSVNRWLNLLAKLVTVHPELATLIQALVAPRPDEPDDTNSSQAGSGP